MQSHDIPNKSRSDFFCEIPKRAVKIVSKTTEVAVGLIATVPNMITFGSDEKLRHLQANTMASNGILKEAYGGIVSVLNPSWGNKIFVPKKDKLHLTSGFFSSNLTRRIQNSGFRLKNENDFANRHIFSRACFALSFLTTKISRIADFVLGLVGLALTAVTFGQSDAINTFTLKQLEITGILYDYNNAICGFINPQAL